MAFSQVAACVIVLLVACSAVEAKTPGISVRLSQEFFNYTYQNLLAPAIKKQILNAKLPPVTYHIGGINTDLFLQNLQLDKSTYAEFPSASITPQGDTQSFQILLGIFVQGGGRWMTRARWWPHIESQGSVQFWVRPVYLKVDISMGPGPGGIWQFKVTRLVETTNVAIKFHGGVLAGLDVGALREFINKKVSQAISKKVRVEIANALQKITPAMKKYLPYLTYPNCAKMGLPSACKDFGIDLSLVSNGTWVTDCRAEIQLDGYMVYQKKSFYPAAAHTFPAPAGCGNHGVAVYMSGSTFSSAISAILASKLVHGNFPSGKRSDFPLYNRFLPGLKKKFGSQPLFFNMTLLDSQISLSPGMMTTAISVSFQILVDTTPAKRTGKVFTEAFTMEVDVTVSMRAWIRPTPTPIGVLSMLYLNFTNALVTDVSMTETNIGPANMTAVRSMMQTLLSTGFTNADSLVSKGVLIVPPKVKGAYLKHPQILIGQDFLKLAIDVSGTPKAKPAPKSPTWFSGNDEKKRTARIVRDMDPSKLPTTMSAALDSTTEAFIEAYQMVARSMQKMF